MSERTVSAIRQLKQELDELERISDRKKSQMDALIGELPEVYCLSATSYTPVEYGEYDDVIFAGNYDEMNEYITNSDWVGFRHDEKDLSECCGQLTYANGEYRLGGNVLAIVRKITPLDRHWESSQKYLADKESK